MEKELYREHHEYVVCTECGSHLLISQSERMDVFDPFFHDPSVTSSFWGFTCDNDDCGADQAHSVNNPFSLTKEMKEKFDIEISDEFSSIQYILGTKEGIDGGTITVNDRFYPSYDGVVLISGCETLEEACNAILELRKEKM